MVEETDFVEILVVFGEGVFVDGFDVELEGALDEVLEVAGKGLFRLFGNVESDGPGDGHEEQIEDGGSVTVVEGG